VSRTLSLVVALVWRIPLCAQGSPGSTAPAYTGTTIVNSATSGADGLAPNTLATIYGTNLSYGGTDSVGALGSGTLLPQEMAGVQVYVAGSPVSLYYVSPQQVNFLIPANLRPGEVDLFVARDGTAGPHTSITLHDVGPGLFESEPGVIIATHADGSLVTQSHPAKSGETVTVYGTGFGPINPDAPVSIPVPITDIGSFQVLVNGVALPATSVAAVCSVPYTPGLYEATFKLPKSVTANPEIRVAVDDQSSPPKLKLPLR